MIYYTDGAASNNTTKNGGWAWCSVDNDIIISYDNGNSKDTTNNIMEMTAIIKAMENAISNNFVKSIFYTDSAYIANCFAQKWYENWRRNNWITSKRTPVLNRELWEKILYYVETYGFSVIKVKGHSTNVFNNYADELAVKAKKELK